MSMPPDDPLDHAERQMLEHEADLHRALAAKLLDRLGPNPWDRPLDELRREMQAASEQLIADDDPEAREIAERLRLMQRFRTNE